MPVYIFGNLKGAIAGMEVRQGMVTPVHVDDDTEKPAYLGHVALKSSDW
jgi:hypothetical protein